METLPRYHCLHTIDKTAPSRNWLKLINKLPHKQAAVLLQLRTNHGGLNAHLFKIGHSPSPDCLHCPGVREEVHHFLFVCPAYRYDRHPLHRKFGRHAHDLSFLLTNKNAQKPLIRFIHDTHRLSQTFGSLV